MFMFRTLVAGVFLTFASLANSHPNHSTEPVTRKDVVVHGNETVQTLIRENKLSKAWQRRQMMKVETRETESGVEWVIRYRSPNEQDPAKQMLDIVFDEMGNVLRYEHPSAD